MTTQLMPAAFFGHGSPMNAIEDNRWTAAWAEFGASVPRPRAILVVSAHWYFNASAVTAMATPRTIHDFYGFPPELFAIEYPAPGLPGLVDEITEVARPTWIGADIDQWGIDHGAWSVLRHAFPGADIPVVQLAIDAFQPLEYHLGLGARLAPLRERGVLVIGSGNIVHNLGALRADMGQTGYEWNHRFDEAVGELLAHRPGDAARLQEHPDFSLAVPTPDHFIPMVYVAGLAAAAGRPLEPVIDGYLGGSLSMTSYVLR